MEMEAEPGKETGSGELRFDLTPLKEMQGDVEPQGGEAMPRYADVENTIDGMGYSLEPVKEAMALPSAVGGASLDKPATGGSEALNSVEAGVEHQEETAPKEETEDTYPVIEGLANELLNSAYLELWSIGLLRKDETDEALFLRSFDSYHGRLEKCIAERESLLAQTRDIESLEAEVSEASVQLDELEVRKSLGDLNKGEYDAMAPALRWTIGFHEGELDRRRRRMALLENPMGLMPPEKVREAAAMAEDTLRLVREAEASARLSPGTAAKVRASIESIEGLLEKADQPS